MKSLSKVISLADKKLAKGDYTGAVQTIKEADIYTRYLIDMIKRVEGKDESGNHIHAV